MARDFFFLLTFSNLVILAEFVLIVCLIWRRPLRKRWRRCVYRLRWFIWPKVRVWWQTALHSMRLSSGAAERCWFEHHAHETRATLAADIAALQC
jgi:hypothetical protein